ncbi:MAG: carbohydrate binding family 9 domain-containing protein [Gemmatimonadota bacterium]|nr:carbohydrate binding family 9 domain-containing protein [Gemmatimonadota bacterium]
MRIQIILLSVGLGLSHSAPGQTTISSATPALRASRATQPIRIDGKLDEADWASAEVATDFSQRYPDPGKPATLRTEVRVLYDAEAVYVGARMYDPSPDSIAAPLGRRDPGDISSDWFDVIFDSQHDRRTGYRFAVNPAGTKLDVYHFNDGDDDISWDALWDVATRIDSLGWTAEYRIPLSQLRFHGSAGEQVWGLQFYRAVIRRGEWTFWAPYVPTTPGFVSAFGELRGIVGLSPPSPVEAIPYVSSKVTTGQDVLGSPFRRNMRVRESAGVDFRVGIGSSLSVTGTVNPDFGQVEVDPALLNLSGIETFLPEKRPFFLEGAGIFEFGTLPVSQAYGFSRFVHWRRIGRAPQLEPDAQWIDAPEQTRILGATKLSGQVGGGWSIGVVDAVTQREQARIVDASGKFALATVEPATNYFVGRAKRDFDDGRTTIGVLSTAVDRSMDPSIALALRKGAYLLGVDGMQATRDRRWQAGGYFVTSLVAGSASSIAATQQSSVRYFGRPDAPHLGLNPSLTSLRGHDAAAGLVYTGAPVFGSVQAHETSPGYEANDLGYLSRADVRSLTAAIGASHTAGSGLLRDAQLLGYTQQAWNFGGAQIFSRVGANAFTELPSKWTVGLSGSVRPAVYDDRLTRGGPIVRIPGQRGISGSISSDSRKVLRGNASAVFAERGPLGSEAILSGILIARPSPSVQVSLAPSLDLVRNEAQYIRTVADPLATSTFANRYVFATLRQRTVSVDARVDWTFTPALSFQLFSEPFASNARFTGYKQLRAPGLFQFDAYGRDLGTVTRLDNGSVEIDPDGSGPAPSFFLDPASNQASFLSRALRVNAVLRWEYRSGSILYLVLQQTRDQSSAFGDNASPLFDRLLAAPARNVLLLKATYRFGR